MRYLSVCSGIEAATVAWRPLEWNAVAFSEVEAFPSAVLAHHYPHVPNLGDMTQIDGTKYRGKVDVLVGGTPCQSFSVAGLRQGLSDERGNLTLRFVELTNAIKPIFTVWENVPGILSSKDNAFGCFLAGLVGEDIPLQPPRGKWTNAGAVYGKDRNIAWRTLDAQYFGLPQRRRRIFLVACPREGADPAQILFERTGMRGDIKKGGCAREESSSRTEIGTFTAVYEQHRQDSRVKRVMVSPTLTAKMGTGGNNGPICLHGAQDPLITAGVTQTVGRNNGLENCIIIAGNTIRQNATQGGNGQGWQRNVAYTLTANDHHAVCINETGIARYVRDDVCMPLRASDGINNGCSESLLISAINRVRRLTPVECERLQGFPDNYTQIPYRGKDAVACPDSPRYKAIGNSMAVPVMAWLGKRIQESII